MNGVAVAVVVGDGDDVDIWVEDGNLVVVSVLVVAIVTIIPILYIHSDDPQHVFQRLPPLCAQCAQ